ncbi:MAG: ArsR family transcriptional regulator [Candidatus Bathyarchaeia archaeon]|nr:ArsR family transcriptional regulator [Candidatus Bathyarchaeota archaeon]
MLVRIVRNLTPEEVEERIRRFELEFGMTFEKFEELFLKQRLDAKFADAFFEWAELIDSYRGYLEEGTLDYVMEEVKELKPENAAMLTPKRIELLRYLANSRVESINDLAKKLRRNVKNVYQDLQTLKKIGFVKLNKRKGKAVIPETLVREIAFIIR